MPGSLTSAGQPKGLSTMKGLCSTLRGCLYKQSDQHYTFPNDILFSWTVGGTDSQLCPSTNPVWGVQRCCPGSLPKAHYAAICLEEEVWKFSCTSWWACSGDIVAQGLWDLPRSRVDAVVGGWVQGAQGGNQGAELQEQQSWRLKKGMVSSILLQTLKWIR